MRRVDHQAAGDALLGAAGIVARGGVALLENGGHGADAVAESREFADEVRQPVVHELGEAARLFQKRFARGDIELRVVPEKDLKITEGAVEAGRFDLLLHGGADAGDFGIADVENLVRGQRRRRLMAHAIGVVGAAAGHV